jgi:hypothetical protein
LTFSTYKNLLHKSIDNHKYQQFKYTFDSFLKSKKHHKTMI